MAKTVTAELLGRASLALLLAGQIRREALPATTIRAERAGLLQLFVSSKRPMTASIPPPESKITP